MTEKSLAWRMFRYIMIRVFSGTVRYILVPLSYWMTEKEMELRGDIGVVK